MKQLVDRLASSEKLARLRSLLGSRARVQADGLWGCSAALVLAGLAAPGRGTFLLVTSTLDEAEDAAAEIELSEAAEVMLFTAHETFPPNLPEFGIEQTSQRSAVARRLSEQRPDRSLVVVAPVDALLQRVVDRRTMDRSVRVLAEGQHLEIDDLLEWFDRHGYERVYTVDRPGQYAQRGGIVDAFGHAAEHPVRLDFFGDEIDSIRRFDVSEQTSVGRCRRVEMMGLVGEAMQSVTVHDFNESVLEYLRDGSVVAFRDQSDCETQARAYLARLDNNAGHDTWEQLARRAGRFAQLLLWSFRSLGKGRTVSFHTSSLPPPGRELRSIVEHIEELADAYDELYVFCSNESQGKQFLTTARHELKPESFAKITASVGDIGRGVCFDDVSAALMNHRELFGHQRTRLTGQRQFSATAPLHSLGELGEMDYVVHSDFGIARYLGMEVVEKEGRTDEFLVLEFARKAKVFVPVGRIELVQKYLGTSHENPQLSRLGTGAWEKRKQKAMDAAREMAGGLLTLQGKRQAAPGIAFQQDTQWQRDFEAAFPYEETPDQLDGMAAIKDDMQQTRPMDRLICGDVGYGKTELAIRAAFKAATAGYQVAVLVPTTILAQQHWRTFSERMAEYPVEVDVLSRFKSRAEQDKLLARLAEGRLDIVIGTHRLISQDVHFRNLGLIVVDEEQRFGVKAKEALKAFRATVDVLTLTATPIPRTLNMGLLGLRDISSLETPPLDRLSVRTQVTYFDPPLIRQAMMRELNRQGQIFFIHNRVASIKHVANEIQAIVPEADIRVAHGQMPAHQLEQIMMDFIEGKFNTLVCTTIVESGLDIPNANTLFVNNAHMFGLADLHQLRGRVGRYTRRAYAYFLVPRDTVLPEDAVKRLKAIEDFSDLGAGFRIAMRDLEIRGAGNIIGTEQSGHIDAVGYDLYCRLLREAVDNLKGQSTEVPPDAHVDLAVRAFVPDDYIARAREKVDVYRRLGQCVSEEQVDEIAAELTDRFGPAPPGVHLLMDEARIRIVAGRLGVTEIKQTRDRLIVRYTDAGPLEKVLSPAGKLLRIIDGQTVHVMLPESVSGPQELVDFARKLLRGEAGSG